MPLDPDLIRAAQHGDREAFGVLASSLARPFLATSRRILRDLDRAEDATQEALLGIWRGLPALRQPDRFESWAYRILVRACYDEAGRVREASPKVRLLSVEPSDPPDPADPLGRVVDREQLERAFHRLSIEQRAVVVLRYFADLPLSRLAAVLGIPEGTVDSRLHYAIATLRGAIEADARPAFREAAR